jgi:hypothetical protein
MNPTPDKIQTRDESPVRLPYAKPELKRVDLAMDETLSKGCKLEADAKCTAPPIPPTIGGS